MVSNSSPECSNRTDLSKCRRENHENHRFGGSHRLIDYVLFLSLMCFSFSIFFSFHLFSTYRSKQSKQTKCCLFQSNVQFWPTLSTNETNRLTNLIFVFFIINMDIFFLSLSLFSLCFLSFSLFTGHRVLCVFFSLSSSSCSFFLTFSRETSCSHDNSHIHTHPFIYNTSFWHPCFNACVHFTPPWHFCRFRLNFATLRRQPKIENPKTKSKVCVATKPCSRSHQTEIGAFLCLFVL